MRIYRMVLAGYEHDLRAPGVPGRWNSQGKMVLYCSESRSLSCLENIVHRSTEGLLLNFFVIVIEIPDKLKIEFLEINRLPEDWYLPQKYKSCQAIGDAWIGGNQSCLLKVPSAIIQEEYNYLINVNHGDFKGIKISASKKFHFDPRITKSQIPQ